MPQLASASADRAGWASWPQPDPAVLSRLSRRLPWLDTSRVRAVPFEAADAILSEAVNNRGTYLDVLTRESLRSGHPEIYYIPPETLARIGRKYHYGTLPVEGTDVDGRPFRMEAFVAGGGSLHFVYDRAQPFKFPDNDNEIKITGPGVVSAGVAGPRDATVSGLAGCGCILFLCGCADIQRMTQTGPDTMDVQTSRGPRSQKIKAIRYR